MPTHPSPITHPTAVEASSQAALNFLLAEVQRVHPGATIAQHPDLAIEALCILVGGALAKNRELQEQLAQWLGDAQPQ
jgi:hypothetical protein